MVAALPTHTTARLMGILQEDEAPLSKAAIKFTTHYDDYIATV